MAHFPEGFLWGASTAAHQVEGNNRNSDFSEGKLERLGLEGTVRRRSRPIYNRFKSDLY